MRAAALLALLAVGCATARGAMPPPCALPRVDGGTVPVASCVPEDVTRPALGGGVWAPPDTAAILSCNSGCCARAQELLADDEGNAAGLATWLVVIGSTAAGVAVGYAAGRSSAR